MNRPAAIWRRVSAHMSPPVFFGAAVSVIGFCVFGAVFTDRARTLLGALQRAITASFGPYYLLLTSLTLVLSLGLMVSPWRRVRIGGADARPDFSRVGWIAMLFSAGMGIGLVFWSVAEPLHHFSSSIVDEPGSPAAAADALRWSFFHWGLHPWAIYAVLGLSIALMHFNRDARMAPRSVLRPWLGTRTDGGLGHAVDVLCTVGTLLGVSTSLGLGAMQISAGIGEFTALTPGLTTQLVIIGLITLAATVSVVSGVDRGIRRLSQFSLILAAAFLVFVLAVGPSGTIFESWVRTLGTYLQNLPRMSLNVAQTVEAKEWQKEWTFFYWGWWISWSPFVGIFLARISKGRTVGEFLLVVLAIPTLVTFAWFAAFGTTALELSSGPQGELVQAARAEPAVAFHRLLTQLPLASLTLPLATVLIAIFFVTSSDSGSFVDDMVTSGGDPNPPKAQRVFWASAEGVAAAVLLALGGLEAMRNASISLGLPMSLLIIVAAFALLRILPAEARRLEGRRPNAL